jgi:hypothetical protein
VSAESERLASANECIAVSQKSTTLAFGCRIDDTVAIRLPVLRLDSSSLDYSSKGTVGEV